MYYILNFDNHEFVSCDNATEVELKIRDFAAAGCNTDSLEIVNGFGDDVRLSVDEFREQATNNGLFEKVYIYPRANYYCNLDDISVMSGIVEFRTPSEEYEEGVMTAPRISIRLIGEYSLDGSFKKHDELLEYYDSEGLYTNSYDEAMSKAEEVAELADKVKALPRVNEPESSHGHSYFDVIDVENLTDEELVDARELAKLFVGPQTGIVYELGYVMQNRFIAEKKPSLAAQIFDAENSKNTDILFGNKKEIDIVR